MVSCVLQVSVALWAVLCVSCWHGWARAHEERLEADGGQGEQHAMGFRGGGGKGRDLGKEKIFIGSTLRKKKKKLLMVLLHDWAFVTAIVLPDTSARGQQAPRQLVSNQSLSTSSWSWEHATQMSPILVRQPKRCTVDQTDRSQRIQVSYVGTLLLPQLRPSSHR